MNLCTIKMPQRKPQNCLVQSVEKLGAKARRQQSERQARLMENLAEGQRLIPLTRGRFAVVDADDFERINKLKWLAVPKYLGSDGFYAKRNEKRENGKTINVFMHRMILEIRDGFFTDHINGNGLDNRKCNLREVTNRQNCRAKKRKALNKTSKYRGVYFSNKKWMASILIRGDRQYFVGSFNSELEASKARDKKAIEFGFFNESLNFPS
jgi:hypothetical protein